jgi:IS5 family transposase
MQDATFIEADPGSSKEPRGEDSKTRRSRDGTWAKKGDEIHFGYKLHQKTDIDYLLIHEIETTTARCMTVRSTYLQMARLCLEIKVISA